MTTWQEDLSKFKKQQLKCQSTLTSIAAKAEAFRAPSQKPPALGTSYSATARSPAPAVKFSQETEKLQQISNIRKAPIGSQIKRVIDLLRETRQALTPEQINEKTYVDINGNKAVFDSLRNNLKVRYDGGCFSYKSTHDLRDKNHLLALIKKFPEGIAVTDLEDSYPTVMNDLQALKADGKIWVVSNAPYSHEVITYPNDLIINVDDDLWQLFRGIKLPLDMIDIEKDLQRNRMKPATETAKRQAKAQIDAIALKPKPKEKKEMKINKRTKLTNKHMPELFA